MSIALMTRDARGTIGAMYIYMCSIYIYYVQSRIAINSITACHEEWKI